jgi:hypothetical protein
LLFLLHFQIQPVPFQGRAFPQGELGKSLVVIGRTTSFVLQLQRDLTTTHLAELAALTDSRNEVASASAGLDHFSRCRTTTRKPIGDVT